MKHIVAKLLTLILLLFNTQVFAQEWAIAQSKKPSNGHVIVYRYISKFAPGFVRSKQATRVIIVWRYSSENGMPDQPERKQMDKLEDMLNPAIEKTGVATLVLVSTGENLREWTYYATSEQTFFQNLNEALKSAPKFPIEIHVGADQTWQSYEQFFKQVQKR